MEELTSIATFIRDFGSIAVTLLIILGGLRRLWIFGWYYDEALRYRDIVIAELEKERDGYQEQAEASTKLAQEAATALGQALRHNSRSR